jgi:hypothetical protein
MTRVVAVVVAVVALGVGVPGAEAKKRPRISHVPACAAMPGAPCQALIRNWRPDMDLLAARKG